MDKKVLRAQIREQKRAMSEQQINMLSQALAEKFFETEQYKSASTIYGYLPYNQEVRTIPILQRALSDGKVVAVPKVIDDRMIFVVMNDLSKVSKGYAGIPEPIENGPEADDPDALVLMPGLAFDPQGHRVGYGGGFYDRFLEKEPNHPTVALCYSFQVFPELETQEHDIPVDLVLWA